ncbi:unnamed protein product [Linum trigynum]|uniref:Uncharacterized protein n=1 Tax=Linum trigynum TaxID=586398 RepID=A0AAV2CSK7_9ROSI
MVVRRLVVGWWRLIGGLDWLWRWSLEKLVVSIGGGLVVMVVAVIGCLPCYAFVDEPRREGRKKQQRDPSRLLPGLLLSTGPDGKEGRSSRDDPRLLPCSASFNGRDGKEGRKKK